MVSAITGTAVRHGRNAHLAPDGAIYVHCDYRVSSYLRLALDEIFGRESFRNHILWLYSGGGVSTTEMPKKHDDIFWYTRGASWTYNAIYRQYSEGTIQRGRTAIKGESAKLRAEGTPINNWWPDIKKITSPTDPEKLYYPTQKSEELLKRILTLSSNAGDLVADFFVGSGTAAAVAEKLGRKWIATDLGKFGIHTTRKRLIGVQRELKASGKPFRAFEVLNLGRYERQAYLNVGGRLSGKEREKALAQKEREFRELILRAYKAQPFEGSSFFHGKNAGRLVVVGPINLPVGRLFVEEVILECRKFGASRADILAFEFEMGLFPAALEEARHKGIDLAPKYIPADVFDKRAVDKGQVIFHDISFVEATPRYDKRNKLAVQIELTDFSVYYTQRAADAAIANMKDGKNGIICDRGQLYKVTKSKDGVIKKERLTKHWTDWVDYWAVDFDYMSRKEIVRVHKSLRVGEPPATYGSGTGAATIGPNDFEEQWTGGYIFENEWQSYRTRQNRELELKTALHVYERPGRYTVAVKVIDIFGNDTMTLVPISVG